VNIEDEDKTIFLVVSVLPSYKYFKEIILCSNSDTISFEDVKSNLLSKEKFDVDIHADFAERLVVRGRTTEKGNVNRSKNCSKSKNPHASKTCNYCGKLGHIVANYWQLQTRGRKKKIILMCLLKLRLLNMILIVTFCLLPLPKAGAILIGFLILGVPIICVLIRIGFQHMIQLTQLLFTWAIMPNVM